MAYQVLARKYRPQRFSDVIGQDHVTRTLLNALAQDRIAHGYIFSGHRGIGKTTIARILAMALNCRNAIGSAERPTPEPCEVCDSCTEIKAGNAVDVIEIDAATNRGIDEIRELRDAARYRPARDKYKIYILDEAHQITDAAFNALLKTLEEPPGHIIFMMATTQPEDIPQTIRSRCQHFSFHAVKLDDIVGQLTLIAQSENILADAPTLALLAEAGDGSMRDALSIMDQAIASAPTAPAGPGETAGKPSLEIAQVRELMGSVSNVVYEQILEAVHANNSADVLAITGRLLDSGNAAPQLARQFVRYLRNCIVAKITGLAPKADATGAAADLLQISPEERHRAARSAALFSEEDLSRFLSIMLRTFDDLGYRQEQRFHLELGLLKLVHVQRLLPIEDLLTQLGPSAKPNVVNTTTPGGTSTLDGSTTSRGSLTSGRSLTSGGSPASGGSPTSGGSLTPGETTTSGGALTSGAPGPDSRTRAATAPPSALLSQSAASPFEADRTRKVATGSTISSPATTTEGSLALANHPVPASPRPHLVAPIHANPLHTAALTADPITAPAEVALGLDLAALHQAFIAALAAVKGQQSASEQLEESRLSVNGETLEVHTTVSATMLPHILNADAERLLKATLRDNAPGPLKLKLFPGVPSTAPAKKSPRPAATGSAADLAARHPMVRQAQRLFSAEISNVIDLRDKN